MNFVDRLSQGVVSLREEWPRLDEKDALNLQHCKIYAAVL